MVTDSTTDFGSYNFSSVIRLSYLLDAMHKLGLVDKGTIYMFETHIYVGHN